MAGKTGTAQVVKLGAKRLKASQVTYFERDHAWFAAFAPADDPEIVVVVLNEHSGFGASNAAPTAAAVVKQWLELQAAGREERAGVHPGRRRRCRARPPTPPPPGRRPRSPRATGRTPPGWKERTVALDVWAWRRSAGARAPRPSPTSPGTWPCWCRHRRARRVEPRLRLAQRAPRRCGAPSSPGWAWGWGWRWRSLLVDYRLFRCGASTSSTAS